MQDSKPRLVRGSVRKISISGLIAYWIVTVIVALESLIGGILDIMQTPVYLKALMHLGYPAYFSIILGAAKVLAAVTIMAPDYPHLKEWAYAGLTFQFTGAVVSHIFSGDGPSALIAPFVFLCLVISSWLLRPPSRRIWKQ
jgi:hypothetical protein